MQTELTIAGRGRLWAEFAVLFMGVPVAQFVFFDVLGPFIPLIAVFATAVVLLALTRGFRWRELVDCRGLARHVPLILGLFAICIVVIFGIVLMLYPGSLFGFPRRSPDRFLLVIALYPFLSVLGQEIAYRLLFFRRYRSLFPGDATAILASGVAFSVAHAFFQNWVALTLSLVGGLVFAWAYVRTGSFPVVWILHSLAGWTIFTAGLGTFFYHGAIPN